MSEIPQDVVDRMVHFCRMLDENGVVLPIAPRMQLREIAALLPEPVDPDLIEARELFIESEGGIDANADVVSDVRQGAADGSDEVRLLLKGIKRGRELQESGK